MRLLSRLCCYPGKIGTVGVNSVELLGDGWEVKRDNGKHNDGGD